MRAPPDFFIVGHPKCGTTALYGMLRSHPGIYMPAVKEPHFLALEPQHAPLGAKRYPRTLEDYLALFEGAASGQLAGEASTSYLRSPSAAARIAALNPDARIVAMLREPAAFLRSLHLQLAQSDIEREGDFARAIALEQRRREDGSIAADSFWAPALLYSEHIRYVEQLRRYHERFGRERVLVLVYEDFRSDNERIAREVLRFLGVDDAVALEPEEANPTVRVRSQRVRQVTHRVSLGRGPIPRAVKLTAKTVLPQTLLRKGLNTVNSRMIDRAVQPVDEKLMAELRSRFKSEVQATSEYLQRDLVALWGYRDVA